jgi:hypothetical protein
MCCKTRLLLVVGLDGRFLAVPLSSTPDEGVTACIVPKLEATHSEATAAIGGGARQTSLASRIRFCAVAVSSTSSLPPLKPRSRSRSSFRMRFICKPHLESCVRTWSRKFSVWTQTGRARSTPGRGPATGVKVSVVKGFGPPAGRAACQGRVALLAERAVGLHPHSLPAPAAVARSRAGLREDA